MSSKNPSKAMGSSDIMELARRKRARRRLIYGLLAAAIISIVVIAAVAWPRGGDSTIVPLDGAPVYGSSTAPVTVVEFSDFECSACGSFFVNTFPQVNSTYLQTGKVRWGYRHFPLTSIHTEAKPAALASMCAYDQGKFWEFHDILFGRQQEWSGHGAAFASEQFRSYAQELGLVMTQFNSCVSSGKFNSKIDKDVSDGGSYTVDSTPTFFVNARKVEGALSFSEFSQILETELVKTSPTAAGVVGTAGATTYGSSISWLPGERKREQPQP